MDSHAWCLWVARCLNPDRSAGAHAPRESDGVPLRSRAIRPVGNGLCDPRVRNYGKPLPLCKGIVQTIGDLPADSSRGRSARREDDEPGGIQRGDGGEHGRKRPAIRRCRDRSPNHQHREHGQRRPQRVRLRRIKPPLKDRNASETDIDRWPSSTTWVRIRERSGELVCFERIGLEEWGRDQRVL